MKGYVIATIEVTDPEGFKAYQARVPDIVRAHGGRYLVRGGTMETVEGNWPERRIAVLEFPSLAAARAFWTSPDYAAARVLRDGHAIMDAIVVEGIADPAGGAAS